MVRKPLRDSWDVARPMREVLARCEVHDHRMIRRPSLGSKDPAQRARVGCIGAQPVDGLGRKGHQPACAQDRGRMGDFGIGDEAHLPRNPRGATASLGPQVG